MENETNTEFMLWFLDSSSSESSSSSSEYDTRMSSDDSVWDEEMHASVSNFMETIDAYNDTDFKSHFRLQRSFLDQLIVKYSLSSFFPSHSNLGRRPKIEARKEVYIYVWYI